MYVIFEEPSNLANKINFEQNKMFQLVFNLVWAPSLDTENISYTYEYNFISAMKVYYSLESG